MPWEEIFAYLPHRGAAAPLVTTGIYAKVRHPMYTSVIMAVGGYALFFGSWLSLPLWLGVTIFYVIKAVKEERLLENKFPEYAAYRKRTWRLVPVSLLEGLAEEPPRREGPLLTISLQSDPLLRCTYDGPTR